MIVQQKRTGRRGGDKRDPVTGKAQIGAAKIAFEEFDHWDGPTEPGAEGEYIRCTRITRSGEMEWPINAGKGEG